MVDTEENFLKHLRHILTQEPIEVVKKYIYYELICAKLELCKNTIITYKLRIDDKIVLIRGYKLINSYSIDNNFIGELYYDIDDKTYYIDIDYFSIIDIYDFTPQKILCLIRPRRYNLIDNFINVDLKTSILEFYILSKKQSCIP